MRAIRRFPITSAPFRLLACIAVLALACAFLAPAGAGAAVSTSSSSVSSSSTGARTGSLESAASKAGETGRKIAMSLLGLGLAIAAIVLTFRRDFKEAAGVFAVGIVSVLLATPAGINVLRDTVTSLFGA